MKGMSLIMWIILLNVFDCSVCSNVWLRKLLLDPDTPLSCSPQTLWKFRLRFRKIYNSGSYRDIWKKAEVKNCSSQTVTFDILLTTYNCSLSNYFPVTLSLCLLKRQSTGLDSKKMFIFHFPVCVNLNTTLTIDHMIESGRTRLLVGYENGPRNLKESDDSFLNKNSNQTILTNGLLSNRSGLFQNVLWRSRRHTDNRFQDDLRRQSVLKRDNQLSTESFTESKSEADSTKFGLLEEATKLGKKFLRAIFLNGIKKTNSTTDRRVEAVSKNLLNNSNPDGTSLQAQLLDKTSGNRDENKSGNAKSTENTVRKKIDPDSILSSHLLNNTEYTSSVSSLPFRLSSTDNRNNSISSSTSVTSNSSWNTVVELPVIESTQTELTSEQGIVTSLMSTNVFESSYQTVKPFRISTTTGQLIKKSGQPELSSLSTMDATTNLTPKVYQNSTTIQNTAKMSSLRTSAADTNITTISTNVESTAFSFRGSTLQTKESQQPTTPEEMASTSNEKSTNYRRSRVTSGSPETTVTTNEVTTSLLLLPTSVTPTKTNRITTVTFESSTRSNRLSTSVTTSTLTWENVTIPNTSAPTNTSTNSTMENETTTFLSDRTDKNPVQEEDDAYFWPLVLSLVIGIPAIIVFSIAMIVITKKRNIDSSTFFLGATMADEEV